MKKLLAGIALLSTILYGSGVTSGGSSGGGSGILTSINADSTPAQLISGSAGISASTAGGTTTIDGTLLAPKAAPTFTTSANFGYGTASTVPYLDASKNLISSAVTPTQLGYLDATSSVQTQLNTKGVTAGSSSIVTTGTITTGTWSADVIGVTKGGTGLATLTSAGVMVGAGTSTPTFVAPSTSGNLLTSNGAAWASTAPAAPVGGLTTPTTGSTYGNSTPPSVTGINNTGLGITAADSMTSGTDNTALGTNALTAGTTIVNSTAIGSNALASAVGGYDNTAVGTDAFKSVVTAGQNVVVGFQSAKDWTGGTYYNTLVGDSISSADALTGQQAQTAIGFGIRWGQGTTELTAVGASSCSVNNTGRGTTILGATAGTTVTSGSHNIFIGSNSGQNTQNKVQTGSGNMLFGPFTHPFADNPSGEIVFGSVNAPTYRMTLGQGGDNNLGTTLYDFLIATSPASGSNASPASGTLSLSAAQGTGTVGGADILFKYAPAGASSSTKNALVTAGSVNGATSGFTLGAASTTPTHAINGAVKTDGASAGTLTNAPSVGNPTGFLKVTINGTLSYIPYWQ